MGKKYTLKNKNKSLIDFTDNTDISEKGASIYPVTVDNIYSENAVLLPIDLQRITGESIFNWIIERKIPKNRKNAFLLLKKCNLQSTAFGYIDFSKGLSVTDTYWIAPYGSQETWEDCNLYRHPFNESIASLAFTGKDITIDEEPAQDSPEFTTNGVLPKKWIRRNDHIYLMKGSGYPFNNDDGRNEPFAEMYASQVADFLNLKHIPYDVKVFTHEDGTREFVSVCPIYTTERKSCVPMARLTGKENIDYRLIDTEKEEMKIARAFGDEKFFADMIMFDCLIGNTDRHLNNFGVIINADTNEAIEPMPIFDNGGAFWSRNYLKQLENYPDFLFKTEVTPFGISALQLYHRFARPEQKIMLESISEFSFDRNTPYRLSEHTLQVLEQNMQYRAEIMLGLLKKK